MALLRRRHGIYHWLNSHEEPPKHALVPKITLSVAAYFPDSPNGSRQAVALDAKPVDLVLQGIRHHRADQTADRVA
jgi:hypothetical protein